MTLVDVVLLVVALGAVAQGLRRGLLAGLLGVAGFVGGALLGALLSPHVTGSISSARTQAVVAVVVVLVVAAIGQGLAAALGMVLRARLTWRPARFLDSGLGGLVTVVGLLLVVWFVGGALRTSSVTAVSAAVRDSVVITTVDRFVPDGARSLAAPLRRAVTDSALQPAFGSLSPESILPVEDPDPQSTATPQIAQALNSVVEVYGSAHACGRTVTGTGFVVDTDLVVTNAHVVAGVTEPFVAPNGRDVALPATVVAFDSQRDLAVLRVPGLDTPALTLGEDPAKGDEAVVAGYPQGGPLTVEAARVREVIAARGPNIYGTTQVDRSVLSLLATVRPGDSGGALLSPEGKVLGVVFATSLDNPETGYALSLDELRPVLDPARGATVAVDTQGCAVG